jgi:hypothetical protein
MPLDGPSGMNDAERASPQLGCPRIAAALWVDTLEQCRVTTTTPLLASMHTQSS